MDTRTSGTLPWTPLEFENLLAGVIKNGPTPQGLRPGRWPRDVTELWNAIHRYHTQPQSSALSPMMRRRLEDPRGRVQCAVCQSPF
jgi:hypothetical protein